jgi:hypothetical protein
MLNLQTVAEDLGTFCGGKAWMAIYNDSKTFIVDANIGAYRKRSERHHQ